MVEMISRAEFARRVGCSQGNVDKAIANGRISVTAGFGRLTKINWEKEIVKFVRTSQSPAVIEKFKHLLRDKVEMTGKRAVKASKIFVRSSDKKRDKSSKNKKKVNDLFDAQESMAISKAKKAELEYQVASGKLVSLELVLNTYLDISTGLQTSIMSIPDRIAPMCEGLSHSEIHILLTKELKHSLTELAENIKDRVSPDQKGKR